jgi:hypothetical protein
VDLIARAILVTLSLALGVYGLVVWMDYGGATARLASTIAGEDAAAKLSPKLARWWGALPLLVGLAGLIGVLPLPGIWAMGPVALVVAYYIVMMRLGSAIRSQTVIEDGIKLVVLNSQHPLFRERKGDIWYQLETAASEICKSIEGVSVAEYERRVNEIVLLAFRLRRRRRKARIAAAQLKILP